MIHIYSLQKIKIRNIKVYHGIFMSIHVKPLKNNGVLMNRLWPRYYELSYSATGSDRGTGYTSPVWFTSCLMLVLVEFCGVAALLTLWMSPILIHSHEFPPIPTHSHPFSSILLPCRGTKSLEVIAQCNCNLWLVIGILVDFGPFLTKQPPVPSD